MKAVHLVEQGRPGVFEHCSLAEPVPKATEVLVKVHACGLNHLDLWVEEAGLPIDIPLPRILGGEVAGEIVELGGKVEGWQVGDRVAVQANLFCDQCEFCQRGEESLCLEGQLLGMHRDGGFAELVVVPQSALVPLPEELSFETSAALTLAGSTAMHMLTQQASVRENDWVLVVGGNSGVGSAAIQIAKHMGARVISTGSSQEKREFATKLGADHTVDSNDPFWATKVRNITGKRGVDLVIEHVGGNVLLGCFSCLARGGTVVTCGATSGREIKINLWPIFVKQQKLIGSYGRTRHDLKSTLEWAAAGRLKPVIDQVFTLKEVPKAFERLRERSVLGKIIVKPT